jgi:hypothetical protein
MFNMPRLILLALLFFWSLPQLKAQQRNLDSMIVMRLAIVDGDTILVHTFDEFIMRDLNDPDARKRYLKLKRNVKVVMPYAKLAAFRLQMMEDNLNLIRSRRERDKYIKETEKAIKEEFMESLKNLTISQGKLLLKLIHRETGKSTFEILKGYRGNATTFYWGIVANYYDADLKEEYDPIEDYQIEHIIKMLNLE